MPYHGINAHLEPFLPYIEKAQMSQLDADWRLPDNLSRPIFIDIFKFWLTACDRHHGDHCKPQEAVHPDQQPTWLVDVHRECVVPAKPGSVYATLSYVWGRAECFSLTSATQDDLLKDGSLSHTALPKTIRDAMALVAALDLTYLWVDRLCIVQDSPTEKHAQIKAMGSIYSNSYFTIIAAQSHDASGPLSSRPLKVQPSAPWAVVVLRNIGKNLLSWAATKGLGRRSYTSVANLASLWRTPRTDWEVMNIMAADLLRTTWFSRGWTF